MRYPLVIGNLKLNGNKYLINEMIANLRKGLTGISGCTVAIAPPEIYIELAKRAADGSSISISAQNVDINLSGAFTGETSAKMLKDVGVKYSIIGHSERRVYHKESDEIIAKKFAVLKEQGLIPVLCIGETESEYLADKAKEVCVRQIDTILETQGISAFEGAVIAYEPVWAIGREKPASPKKVQEIHGFIRDYISKKDKKIADKLIIQYGGSVKVSSNAEELFKQPDVDGALVGRASLMVDDFLAIVRLVESAKQASFGH